MPAKFVSGCFYRNPAWHRCGHVLQEPVPIERFFQLAEALYEVNPVTLWFDIPGTDQQQQVEGYKGLIRTDTRQLLSVVSDDYRVLSNASTLLPLAQALREDTELSAVCVLDDSRRVTSSARILSGVAEVGKDDPVQSYITAVNSFAGLKDKGLSFTITITPVRVVCWNTLCAALHHGGASGNIIRIPHVGNAEELVKRVPSIIDFGQRRLTATIEELQAMTRQPCSTELFRQYLELVWADDLKQPINEERGNSATQRERRLEDLPGFRPVMDNFNGKGTGMDMPHAAGTMYGAYNAVTEFLSHQYLDGCKNDEVRRNFSLQFGKNRRVLAQAHSAAISLSRT